MRSELLGELNVSHTGGRYSAPSRGEATANLGLLFDWKYGVWDFMGKPYDPTIVRFRVKNVIERSQMRVDRIRQR